MARDTDPVLGFHFQLEVQGRVTGYFTEIGGLGSEHEVIEHKVVDRNGNDLVQTLPGRLKWQPITLKRGLTSVRDVWDWRKMVEDGKVSDARSNGSIIMMNQSLQPVAQWDFVNAWPSKVTGPQIQADSNTFAIEEMTIVHEGIVRTL